MAGENLDLRAEEVVVVRSAAEIAYGAALHAKSLANEVVLDKTPDAVIDHHGIAQLANFASDRMMLANSGVDGAHLKPVYEQ